MKVYGSPNRNNGGDKDFEKNMYKFYGVTPAMTPMAQ